MKTALDDDFFYGGQMVMYNSVNYKTFSLILTRLKETLQIKYLFGCAFRRSNLLYLICSKDVANKLNQWQGENSNLKINGKHRFIKDIILLPTGIDPKMKNARSWNEIITTFTRVIQDINTDKRIFPIQP